MDEAAFTTPHQGAEKSIDGQIAQGFAEQNAGNFQAALDCFLNVARLDPTRAPIFLLIGNLQSNLGDWSAARESYQRAVEVDPNFADAYNNLGLALLATGAAREAIAAFSKAIDKNPHHVNAYFNLGKMCARHEEFGAAVAMLERSLGADPRHAYALHELGSVQEKCGRIDRAAALYRHSMILDPTRAVRANLAAVLSLLGDPEGIAMQRQLVREQPDDAEAHWNLGISLLVNEQYREGWAEFEWRIQIPRFRERHREHDKPRWRGESLEGKTILLYGEQGHGDTLQFLRYIPLLSERCSGIVLNVPPLLRELLQGIPGVKHCCGFGDPRPEFDTYTSLMSLPLLVQPDSIPPPVLLAPLGSPRTGLHPWGGGPPAQRSAPGCSGKLQVGINWAGAARQMRDRLRSIPLAQWNSLARMGNVEFTSLQMGPSNAHAPSDGHCFHFVEDCADLPDFVALAAVIARLDLVITVDTAVAHLAGTIGKTVWILLPAAMDWRWGVRGTETPWYPTARLFRQTTPGEWSSVMTEVVQALQAIAGN